MLSSIFRPAPFNKIFTSIIRSVNMGTKSALILIADGNEEMELVIPADVLTRAAVNVTIAGIDGQRTYKCSRNVKIESDISLEAAKAKGPYDVIILPGGLNGAKAFAESSEVGNLLKEQESAGRTIAAICAAPTALLSHGIGYGKNVTCYPSMKEDMMQGSKYTFSEERVVTDGQLITSQGPGTAFEFAICLVRHLQGDAEAESVIGPLLLKL